MSVFETLGFGPRGWGEQILLAALMTLAVSLVALLIGAVFGSLAAWAKLSRWMAVRALGDAYTTVGRGIPELLVIYLFYFGGSAGLSAIGHLLGFDGFIGLPPFLAGALAVGIISGAYQTEVYRGAFLSVSKGEIEAGRSIGMSSFLLFRRIIAPQVLRFAIPGLGNVWQIGLKDSALIAITGLAELARVSQTAAGSTGQPFLFYAAGGALYLVLTGVSNRVFTRAEAHTAKSFRRSLGRG